MTKTNLKQIVLSMIAVVVVVGGAIFFSTQKKINVAEVNNLPQIELSDLPKDFSIQNSKKDSYSAGKEKKISFENKAFQKLDLSSYAKAREQEFISFLIVHYNNESDLEYDTQQAKNAAKEGNNFLSDMGDVKLGDDQYMYRIVKPVTVEGHNYIILGMTFRVGNVIVGVSDSGLDETLLKNRVIELSKLMESRVKNYLGE